METGNPSTELSDSTPPESGAVNAWKTFTGRERFSLTLGSLVCGLLAMGLSKVLRIPSEPGFSATLILQNSPLIAIGLAWLLAIGGTLLGAIFTIRLHYDAGLFCTGVGLAVLSLRCGPMKYTLFHAGGAGVFLTLVIELVLLWIAVVIGWAMLRQMAHRGILTAEVILDPTEPDLSIDQKVLATMSQAMLMVILLLLLCQSDSKPQVLASVGLAAFLGTLGSHQFVATRPSIWFWSAPILVGIFGYVMQYFTPSTDWMIGDVRGFFAPLARPMPLDYVSFGTAGSIMGYWTSQQWHHESISADSN